MKREEVKEKYKWNVKDIFTSDEQWEKAAEELNAKLDFSEYQGKLGDKSTLLKYFKANDALSLALE
ncbi:MAG: oligoendopeptidase F, partial [Clostridia bacterium]|nr:oligoendopeptidase F [Clostridia bacterium]